MEQKVYDGASLKIDHPLIPAKRVCGADVYNQAKEKIGTIVDIAIDKRTGKVAYAILSFGGVFRVGDEHQPLPWSVLDYDAEQKGYIVAITKEFLALAPKLNASDVSDGTTLKVERNFIVITGRMAEFHNGEAKGLV